MHILVDVLLAVGAGAALLSSLGVLMVRDFYDRLHYLGPVGSVGAGAIAASLLIAASFSTAGIKAVLAGALVVVSNAVLTHATARAGRVHQLGNWKPRRGEDIVREKESGATHSRGHEKKKTRRPRNKKSRK